MTTVAADVSIIVPCFNEGSTIESSLAALAQWFGPDDSDIIVVDDGSSDATCERASSYARAHPQVRVHRLTRNQGKGAAVLAAVPLLHTARAIVIDADLAYDADSIRAAVAALESAEVAIGNRRHELSRYSVPVRLFGFLYRRHVVGLAFNAFVRSLLPLALRDTQCGLKAFRTHALRRVARHARTTGFAFDIEMLLIARALQMRVAEVPVRVTYHTSKTTVRLLRNGAAAVWEVFTLAVRHRTGYYRRLMAGGAP
jgi:glycosyltransferase involved in cell wall biosynthesis